MPSDTSSKNRREFLKRAGTAAMASPALATGSAWGAPAPRASSNGLPPLKITEVRTIVTNPGRNYVLVKILTSEPGLYGVGDATLNGRELAVASDLENHIAPLLIGRDPEMVEDIYQFLYRGPYWRGGPGYWCLRV